MWVAYGFLTLADVSGEAHDADEVYDLGKDAIFWQA